VRDFKELLIYCRAPTYGKLTHSFPLLQVIGVNIKDGAKKGAKNWTWQGGKIRSNKKE
jgi:hypothetical protein